MVQPKRRRGRHWIDDAYVDFKPFRDRPVSMVSVDCPVCGTPAGEHCMSANGNRVQHRERRRLALRAERDAA